MNKDEIIEKIKKLLRMKRGGTMAEVETALAMAAKLAREHGIDLSSVDPEEKLKSEEIKDERIHIGSRVQDECKYAGMICDSFFNVTVFTFIRSGLGCWSGSRRIRDLVFVGTAWDIQIATYVCKFLFGHFRRTWNNRSGRIRNRQAFMWGMYVGLSSKLREAQPEVDETSAPGLILISRKLARSNYIAKRFGELTSDSMKPDSDADQAMHQGYIAGRETEIRRALDGKVENPLQLA